MASGFTLKELANFAGVRTPVAESLGAKWLENEADSVVSVYPRKGNPARDEGMSGDSSARDEARDAITAPGHAWAWTIVADLAIWKRIDWHEVATPAKRSCSEAHDECDASDNGRCFAGEHVSCLALPHAPADLAGLMVVNVGRTMAASIAEALDERDDEAADEAYYDDAMEDDE